jgi:DnaJ family protein A protein 5
MGRHPLSPDLPTLIYMPHCPKPLYESILSTNYSTFLAAHILLGNELADYVPSLARPNSDNFDKPKKKRKDKTSFSTPPDSVLRRLGESLLWTERPLIPVPHLEVLPLSDLPDTNLPGFARAFLSLSFQSLPVPSVAAIDWDTPLPDVIWPEDGEVI